MRTANEIVGEHYRLKRKATAAEVEAEIANIKRRGPDNLDDSLHFLAAKLNVFRQK